MLQKLLNNNCHSLNVYITILIKWKKNYEEFLYIEHLGYHPRKPAFTYENQKSLGPWAHSLLQRNDGLYKMQTFKLIFNCLMSWFLVEHCCLKNKLGNSIKWLQKIHHIRCRKALTPAWTWRPTSLHLFDKWILENNWNTWLPA